MDPEEAPISDNVAANQTNLPQFIDSVSSQFIVTPTSTPSILGVSGFIFNIIGDEQFMVDAEITDSYTEDNTTIQDQIALRPEQFTLSGYVGELVNNFPNQFTDVITTAALFASVPNMGITFNSQDEQFYDELALAAAAANTLITTAQNIYNLFSSVSTTATNQQNALQYFYNLWLSRTLCQVETPWGVLGNMAIMSVRARQDETTRLMSDFSVTFKAMRFASTTSTMSSSPATTSTPASSPPGSMGTSGRATQVLATPTNAGSVEGSSTPNATLSQYMTQL